MRLLLALSLISIGLGRIFLKWGSYSGSQADQVLRKINASPIPEPFLGLRASPEIRKFYSFETKNQIGQTLSMGDHFEKVYAISGLHSRRVAILNITHNFSIHNTKLPSPILSLHCSSEATDLFLFNKRWSCKSGNELSFENE